MDVMTALGRAAAEKRAWRMPWAGPMAARIGGAARRTFRPSALGQTALGAGAGGLATAAEIGTGVADPEMSPEGRQRLLATNMGIGALVGNPYLRARTFFRPAARQVASGGLAPLTRTAPSLNTGRTMFGAGLAAGAPYIANATDATARFARMAQRGLQSPGFQEFAEDPGRYVAGTAARYGAAAGSSEAARDAAHAFGGTLGTTLGGGVAGLVGGHALGGLAGHVLAGDDPSLPYEARRRRERWRTLLGLGGTAVGGVATPLLLARYAPDLVPNLIRRAGG